MLSSVLDNAIVDARRRHGDRSTRVLRRAREEILDRAIQFFRLVEHHAMAGG
jgi:hypothetical protein